MRRSFTGFPRYLMIFPLYRIKTKFELWTLPPEAVLLRGALTPAGTGNQYQYEQWGQRGQCA